MFTRLLAVALLATISLGFAPIPFPKVRKKTGPTPEEIVKSHNGTYRVVSYEYGNGAFGGVGPGVNYTSVTIKDGMWSQVQSIGGRSYTSTYQLKIDPKNVVSGLTLGYQGTPAPTFFGVVHKMNGKLTIAYGARGQESTDPFAPLQVGQQRWVLERMK